MNIQYLHTFTGSCMTPIQKSVSSNCMEGMADWVNTLLSCSARDGTPNTQKNLTIISANHAFLKSHSIYFLIPDCKSVWILNFVKWFSNLWHRNLLWTQQLCSICFPHYDVGFDSTEMQTKRVKQSMQVGEIWKKLNSHCSFTMQYLY